jgi:hypothetical protein
VKTVASDAQHTELRLEHGIANVIVRDPSPDMLTLIDLPGGQVQLLKNGFYTFNAGTDTARVFAGEADAFVSTRDKPVHVKSGDQVAFVAGRARISYSDPYNARADVLEAPMQQGGQGYDGQAYDGQGYAYASPAYDGYYGGGYGAGFYGDSPYYAYGYGYPYGYYGGWGYPGFGFGFGGYYGGGYGYRGGYGYGGGYGGRFPGGGGYPGGGPHPGGTGSFHGGSTGGGGGSRGGSAGGGGGHR